MTCAAIVMLTFWLVAIALTLYGTFLTLKSIKTQPPHLDAPFGLYPVTVLKPLKGVDNGIRENIRTFFELDYPHFELLFSISDANDPVRHVVEDFMDQYPRVDARLIISNEGGAVEAGPNPKVNNMIRTYALARHDLILISDSNVRVKPNALKRLVAHLDNDVGMVTSVVAGRDATTMGGHLESTYLNTFYARWMFLAARFGNPCVVGKSMLFSRKTAARFGGIKTLARYLAEDYMAGVAMQRLGLKVVIATDPVHQHVGRYPVRDFWNRHLRWGRIRKSQAPLAFFFEPLFGSLLSGAIGAIAAREFISPSTFLTFHFGIWSLCDLALSWLLEREARVAQPLAWLLRELLALPLWLHTALGNTVLWRGRKLELQPGGLLNRTLDPASPLEGR